MNVCTNLDLDLDETCFEIFLRISESFDELMVLRKKSENRQIHSASSSVDQCWAQTKTTDDTLQLFHMLHSTHRDK